VRLEIRSWWYLAHLSARRDDSVARSRSLAYINRHFCAFFEVSAQKHSFIHSHCRTTNSCQEKSPHKPLGSYRGLRLDSQGSDSASWSQASAQRPWNFRPGPKVECIQKRSPAMTYNAVLRPHCKPNQVKSWAACLRLSRRDVCLCVYSLHSFHRMIEVIA